MRTFGIRKTFIPTNSFLDVIYTNEKNFFIALCRNSLIKEFVRISISEDKIDRFIASREVLVNDEEFLCFTTERGVKINGFKSEIRDELLILMKDPTTHPGAKCQIAGMFYLNGKVREYFGQYKLDYFKKDLNITYYLSEKDFLNEADFALNDVSSFKKSFEAVNNESIEAELQIEDFLFFDQNKTYFSNTLTNTDVFLRSRKGIEKSEQNYSKLNVAIAKNIDLKYLILHNDLYAVANSPSVNLQCRRLNDYLFKGHEKYQSAHSANESFMIREIAIEDRLSLSSKSKINEETQDEEGVLKINEIQKSILEKWGIQS